MTADELLRVEGLSTRFSTPNGVTHAVNGVDFTVGFGEMVGIVGETGCGKSVTVRSVLGLVEPPGEITAGHAWFQGVDLLSLKRRDLRARRGRDIGFVAQNPFSALNPVIRLDRQFRNVMGAHERISLRAARDRAMRLLSDVGIPSPERVLNGFAHQLSGGMAQRVVIAMALSSGPALVVADEPTTGLDLTIQRQILDLVRQVAVDDARSMLLVTHDLGVVAQYCDRVVVMYAGKVVETGPVSTVLREPRHPYTSALLRAVPRPGHDLVHLPGQIPDLTDYPVGCPFAPRCSHVMPECLEVMPEFVHTGNRQGSACHLHKGVSAHEHSSS